LSCGEAPRPRHDIRDELAKVGKRVSVVAVAVGGIIGATSALLTSLFLVRPNLAQSTGNKAAITDVAVEREVTLEQYFAHFSVKSSLQRLKAAYPDRPQILLDRNGPRLHTLGTVIDFGIEVSGLRGVPVGGRWSVFDADSGKRLGESEDLDPLPLSFKIEKKDSDTGSWESWIDTSSFSSRTFFVRLELFAEKDDTRITFKDTAVFPKPTG
jgi:hypothetical protein